MGSSGRNHRPTWKATSSRLAAAALAAAAVVSGCSSTGSEASPVIDQLVCQSSDVPADYLLQITGDFSDKNLRELEGSSAASETTRFAIEGGRFSYWKQIVSNPPFDPPTNILCEAIEFPTPEAARSFVTAFDPASNEAFPSLAWLPDGPRRVESQQLPSDNGGASRTIAIAADGDATDVFLRGVLTARDRFVQTTYVGGREDRPAYKEQAEVIHSRLLDRTARLVADSRD